MASEFHSWKLPRADLGDVVCNGCARGKKSISAMRNPSAMHSTEVPSNAQRILFPN